jgi:hypothetical protein
MFSDFHGGYALEELEFALIPCLLFISFSKMHCFPAFGFWAPILLWLFLQFTDNVITMPGSIHRVHDTPLLPMVLDF